MNLLSTSLAALTIAALTLVGISEEAFEQRAETEEAEMHVTVEDPVRFLALHTHDAEAFDLEKIQLVARYDSFDAEAGAPTEAKNVVRVLSQNPFDLEPHEVGLVKDTQRAKIELGGNERCDSERCAGYSIITLEHKRGSDAELVLKLEGQWQALYADADVPILQFVTCAEDCQELAEAFLSIALDAFGGSDDFICPHRRLR